MSTEQALAALTYCEIGRSPEQPLRYLVGRRAEVQDRLLAEIGRPSADITASFEAAPDERHGYFLHTFAVYLLALWEEPRAYQPLVAYLAEDTHEAIGHLQDTVTEDLHTILARIYDGSDLGPLKRIIEDDDADSYVRDACLRSLHAMARLCKLPRADAVAYTARVLDRLRGEHNSDWADCIVTAAALLQEPSLRPAIDRWFDDGLVDETLVTQADIVRTYQELPEVIDEQLLQQERFAGLVDYLAGWAWFHATDPADFDDPFEDYGAGSREDEDDGDRVVQQPLMRAGPKIGRNEPCPCGSGKKYKKCCLANEA